jgi:hypothetical protein
MKRRPLRSQKKKPTNLLLPTQTKSVEEDTNNSPQTPASPVDGELFASVPWEDLTYWIYVMEGFSNINPVNDFESLYGLIKRVQHSDNRMLTLLNVPPNAEALRSAIESMSHNEQQEFFTTIVPFIRELVEKSLQVFPERIPILKRYSNSEIVLSREQVAVILANGFFCTFNRQSSELFWNQAQLASINFDDLYFDNPNKDSKVAKILMIINYFRRICKKSKFLIRVLIS